MPTTPLIATHERLGARITEFAGWDMPLQYEGVLTEHTAVRTRAGVFDVSHLGRFTAEGEGATHLLRHRLCNDITKVGPGRAQYTMALNEAGGVEDDIIVWRLDDERYWVLPNGANFYEIVGSFIAAAPDGISIEPVRDETVLLAVQGPDAPAHVTAVLGDAPGRFRVIEGTFEGAPMWAAGTGYTGEAGAEICVPIASGEALLRAFTDRGVVPCGLAARDTLRLEKGYPLWGQDLDAGTTPLEANLGWVVDWDHEFVGREALRTQHASGLQRELIGFALDTRRVPRAGSAVRCGDSEGVVCSGNFSPTLGIGIGLAYVAPPTTAEDVTVTIRNDSYAGKRVKPPFVP